jgi:N-methylhydantoinase A
MKNTERRLAIDVGGTFIDYVQLDEATGQLTIEKQPASAERLVEELVTGLERLDGTTEEIDRLIHGTTIGINAVVQEVGARIGLIATAGFRDVLTIGRSGRAELYNPLYRQPQPLVPRHLRRGVAERMGPDGEELLPLDLDGLDQEVAILVGEGVEAIAVCFLHAYANPAHEVAAAERIRAAHPDLAVTASHEVAGEWREYQRTSSAVLNAFVQPLMRNYLGTLEGELRERGYRHPIGLMQSNGGVLDSRRAAELPVRTLQSGPAGGIIGAHQLATRMGIDNVICADVGGTTLDVGLIESGEVLETSMTEVNGRPIIGSAIDIVSIGAGGGSIAWIDRFGSVRVGPRSAGARPGPVCFGFGGTEPTVTDCQLLLGRLDPQAFLGSRMQLDLDGARRALEEKIAGPTGMDPVAAADGILAIATANMAYAIRAVTVERGLDPRDFAVFSYGGGGGLFAAATAEELEIGTVVVPRAPANFSAWGILTSDYREDRAATRVQSFDDAGSAQVIDELRRLEDDGREALATYGFTGESIDVIYRCDVRYAGQDHTITTTAEGEWLDDPARFRREVGARFVAMHQRLYGHGSTEAPLEVTATRSRAVGRVADPAWAPWEVAGEPVKAADRDVHFGDGFVTVPVWDREKLPTGFRVEGPAIVEEWTTTVVVPPGWSAAPDELGNLVMTFGGRA